MKKVFVHCGLLKSQKDFLKKKFLLDLYNSDKNILSSEELIRKASGYNGIICQGNYVNDDYIEKNTEVFKYTDLKLYEHQARLFESIKREGAKMILYQAPTGTGKTNVITVQQNIPTTNTQNVGSTGMVTQNTGVNPEKSSLWDKLSFWS